MRLGLDIDNVICDFTRGVFKFAGVPYQEVYRVHSYDYKEVLNFKNIWERVKDDETFWLSLPVLDSHIPSCCAAFVSARYCPPETTMRWLKKHNLAKLPLHQTKDKKLLLEIMMVTKCHVSDLLYPMNCLYNTPHHALWDAKKVEHVRLCVDHARKDGWLW